MPHSLSDGRRRNEYEDNATFQLRSDHELRFLHQTLKYGHEVRRVIEDNFLGKEYDTLDFSGASTHKCATNQKHEEGVSIALEKQASEIIHWHSHRDNWLNTHSTNDIKKEFRKNSGLKDAQFKSASRRPLRNVPTES